MGYVSLALFDCWGQFPVPDGRWILLMPIVGVRRGATGRAVFYYGPLLLAIVPFCRVCVSIGLDVVGENVFSSLIADAIPNAFRSRYSIFMDGECYVLGACFSRVCLTRLV